MILKNPHWGVEFKRKSHFSPRRDPAKGGAIVIRSHTMVIHCMTKEKDIGQ